MLAISCEHASAAVPSGVDLGVRRATIRSHTGWDPGAAELAQTIGEWFDVVPRFGRWTRLYVDLNRFATNPAVIPTIAFGTPVPGNVQLDDDDRAERLAHHEQWRSQVQADVHQRIQRFGRCVHLSVHSFTPVLNGQVRDFDVGVLFDPKRHAETLVSERLIQVLREHGITARGNEPYTGWGDGLTTATRPLHPEDRYAGIELEVNQRVVANGSRLRSVRDGLRRAIDTIISM